MHRLLANLNAKLTVIATTQGVCFLEFRLRVSYVTRQIKISHTIMYIHASEY